MLFFVIKNVCIMKRCLMKKQWKPFSCFQDMKVLFLLLKVHMQLLMQSVMQRNINPVQSLLAFPVGVIKILIMFMKIMAVEKNLI